MMVPDEVDMEHEAFKCGKCIVKEMNVMKGEKDRRFYHRTCK